MDSSSSAPNPSLIEPGMKYFLNQTLKQCHQVRMRFHNTIFNVGLFLLFLCILGVILLWKYKGRMTAVEKQQRERDKQEYILSKVKQLQEAKRIAHQELITGLPNWENDYENVRPTVI